MTKIEFTARRLWYEFLIRCWKKSCFKWKRLSMRQDVAESYSITRIVTDNLLHAQKQYQRAYDKLVNLYLDNL